MSNRKYHTLKVSFETTDDVSREDMVEYMEDLLQNITDSEMIHESYVDGGKISQSEVSKILDVVELYDESYSEGISAVNEYIALEK